ncbi:NAD(P)H-dependent oxidoreductase [Vitellibacter sp. q18]|nr:NAD(P)H-dependent oxidoreductase [Aequorivita lutea]
MRTLIIFNHPNDKSYCSAILNSIRKGLQTAGHQIDLIHLDKDGFNPRMTTEDLHGFVQHTAVDPQVINYQQRLQAADHLLFIFPIWWDIMPAATKGFIDRVLSPGIAYDHHPRGFGLIPLLKNLKSIHIITTMNKPKIMYSMFIGNLIRKVMVRSVFRTMGYKNTHWINLTSVKRVSQHRRIKWLHRLEKSFSQLQ